MASTLPQVELQVKDTPVIGRPFNFHGLFQSYLIPRSVACDRALPPGARLLWGIIRQYGFRDGRCFASDETLAAALAVSDRQFRRYVRALENARLVESTARAGKTTIRELLWDSRFAGKIPARRTDVSGGADTNVRGGRTDASAPYKEGGVFSGVPIGKASEALKKPTEKPAAPPAQKPAGEWTEEDYIARGRAMGFPEHVIQRDVERVRRRKAEPHKGRLTKASELTADLEAAIRR